MSSTARIALLGLLASAVLVVGIVVVTETDTQQPDPLALSDPSETYDPVRAGEELPDGFRQILDRDQITPIYDPEFTDADTPDWPDGMLVIGVAGQDVAKAYPVTYLNQREMVLDSIEGEPILVSW